MTKPIDSTVALDKGIKRVMTSYRTVATVAPNDNTDLTNTAMALYVGVAGDITLNGEDGTTVLFKAVPVGILPVVTTRVKATGTTATNIVALS